VTEGSERLQEPLAQLAEQVAQEVVHEREAALCRELRDAGRRVGEQRPRARLALLQRLGDLVELDQVLARVVLAHARAQRRLRRGHQRRHADGTLEQSHVAQRPHRLAHGRRVRTRMRDEEDGQVRPWLLASQQLAQVVQLGLGHQRLLGEEDRARARVELAHEMHHVRADGGPEPALGQHGAGELRIPAERRKDEDAPLEGRLRLVHERAKRASCSSVPPGGSRS
jgi:hypothetical protein